MAGKRTGLHKTKDSDGGGSLPGGGQNMPRGPPLGTKKPIGNGAPGGDRQEGGGARHEGAGAQIWRKNRSGQTREGEAWVGDVFVG